MSNFDNILDVCQSLRDNRFNGLGYNNNAFGQNFNLGNNSIGSTFGSNHFFNGAFTSIATSQFNPCGNFIQS